MPLCTNNSSQNPESSHFFVNSQFFEGKDTFDEVSQPRKYCARRMYVALASRSLQDGVDRRDGGGAEVQG